MSAEPRPPPASWRVAVLHTALPLLGYGVVTAITWMPVFDHGADAWGINDWDQHLSQIEAARRSVLEFGQWPLWNPWQCGGSELLGAPSSLVLSPAFLLVLALGTVPALKWVVGLHLWLGLLGMHQVAGAYGLSGPARVVPPLVFMLSSSFALHVASGGIEWLGMAWLPWTVFFALRLSSGPSRGAIVGAAATGAAAFLGGANYFLLYTGLLCGGIAATRSVQRRTLRPLGSLAVAGLLAAGIAAPKLLPGLLLEARFPRTVPLYGVRELGLEHFAPGGIDGVAELLLRVFLDRGQALQTQIHGIFWVEYGTYLGPLAVLLAVVGISLRVRKFPELAWMPPLLLLVGLGSASPLPLWEVLTALPLLANLNHPPRWFVGVGFCVALGAGLGTAALRAAVSGAASEGRRRLALAAALAVPVVIAADAGAVARTIWAGAFAVSPLREQSPEAEFHQRMHSPSALAAVRADVGTIAAYNHNGRPRSALASESSLYRGELYLESHGGSARWAAFGPRELRFHYDSARADRVVVNQNAAEGWSVEGGAARLTASDGRLAVAVPAGAGEVTLRYRAPGLTAGWALLLATCGASLAWLLGWPAPIAARAALAANLAFVVALAAFQVARAGSTPVPAQAELRAAREASHRSDAAAAAAAWRVVVREYPNDYRAHLTLGLEQLRGRRFREARGALERAVLLAPRDAVAVRMLLTSWRPVPRDGGVVAGAPPAPGAVLATARHYAAAGDDALALAVLGEFAGRARRDRAAAWHDDALRALLEGEGAERMLGRGTMDRLRAARPGHE